MDDAWLCYFPESGKISGIFWEKPDESCIAIGSEMASKFISGELRKASYRVIDRGDGPALEIFQNLPAISKFWSLITIDEKESNIAVSLHSAGIVVKIPDDTGISCLIFATLKNDPSWLIKAWDLRDFDVVNGIIKIYHPDADQLSIYMRKINET